jgi:hypothetical protein
MKEFQYKHKRIKVVDGDKSPLAWLTIRQYERFARLTGKIKFPCDFDAHNHCARTRKIITMYRNHKVNLKEIMACCDGCCYSWGYHERIHEKNFNTYTSLFKENVGFWRYDGCSLPRELRSPTCLRHTCHFLSFVKPVFMGVFDLDIKIRHIKGDMCYKMVGGGIERVPARYCRYSGKFKYEFNPVLSANSFDCYFEYYMGNCRNTLGVCDCKKYKIYHNNCEVKGGE